MWEGFEEVVFSEGQAGESRSGELQPPLFKAVSQAVELKTLVGDAKELGLTKSGERGGLKLVKTCLEDGKVAIAEVGDSSVGDRAYFTNASLKVVVSQEAPVSQDIEVLKVS